MHTTAGCPIAPQARTNARRARTAALRMVQRAIAVAACTAALVQHAHAHPSSWVPVQPSGYQMQYWIDAQSVHAQGDTIYYRLHGAGIAPESRDTTVQAEIGVNCELRTRAAFVSTTRWRENVRTTTSGALQPIGPGQRDAAELALACALARGEKPRTAIDPIPVAGTPDAASGAFSASGFAVAPDVLVTSQHVVQQCSRVFVVAEGISLPAKVLHADEKLDLAAVQVPGAALAPLAIAPSAPELGEPVTVLGFPLNSVLGGDLRVTAGIVSSLRGAQGDPVTMQISAPVQPGNSGGPVVDASGYVIGVVSRKLEGRAVENVAFAVRSDALRSFLETTAVAYRRSPAARPVAAQATAVPAVRRAAPSTFRIKCSSDA